MKFTGRDGYGCGGKDGRAKVLERDVGFAP